MYDGGVLRYNGLFEIASRVFVFVKRPTWSVIVLWTHY